jgi:hypothetical protein
LDQVLVSQLAAVIPLDVQDVVRLAGRRVTAFSLDQAFAEPALDRIGVPTPTASP